MEVEFNVLNTLLHAVYFNIVIWHSSWFNNQKMSRIVKYTLNVVAISQPSKLLLTSCVPHIVLDSSSVGVERQWVHLYSQGG